MADLQPTFLEDRHHKAVEAVRVSFAADLTVANVPLADAPAYFNAYSAVWRKEIHIAGQDWTVFVGLPKRFPDEAPKGYTLDGKHFYLKNPHVMDDGFICTIPNSAAINSNDPAGIVRYVFDDCEKILKGTETADFQDEFLSYWNRSCPKGDQGVLVVDTIENFNAFCVVQFNGRLIAASSADRLNQWLAHAVGKVPEVAIFKGVAIHLNSPLLPDAYPSTLAQLVSIAESSDPQALEQITKHIVYSTKGCLVILVQKQGDGVVLGAVAFYGLGLSTTSAIPGFRAGKAPQNFLVRYASKRIAASNVIRSQINRADHSWIHSRGGDGSDLSNKSVLVIGCGSLGGYVAHLLARAGIGRLTVTDNDHLGWENLGRHVLGANYVGRWKAEALAEELSRSLPHLEIRGIAKDWRDIFGERPDFFNKYDFIISTVGDWRCERPLNELARRFKMPPLCMGWVEPYAVAGHCLVIKTAGGCFECAADEYGLFNEAVAKFDASPLSKEPGGCTHYQHYGPIALMPVATLISSVAVESLLSDIPGSVLKTWVSSKEHFDAVRATVSTIWSSKIAQSGFLHTFKKEWSKVSSCAACH